MDKDTLTILLLGDIVGRAGRDAVTSRLPALRAEHGVDFVLANVDNAAGGFGTSETVCRALMDAGVDVFTGGNHIWDQKGILPYLEREPKLLRPLNYPEGTPGRGMGVFTVRGVSVFVLHLLGQLYMHEQVNDPFSAAKQALRGHRPGGPSAPVILVDFHAETTSEKMAMGHFLDGQVSAVFGTHTHIPTADSMHLPRGTYYQTDLGMCGNYRSVIGFEPDVPVANFTTKRRNGRLKPASGDGAFCGALLKVSLSTGLPVSSRPLRLGWPFDRNADTGA